MSFTKEFISSFHSTIRVWVSLSIVLSATVQAEIDTGSGLSGASPAPVFSTPELPKAPQPVTPKPRDRKDGSGAAQAAAAAGAAIAGAMCALLMREAMKEKDPQQRMMLLQMASQQCSQAAQSMQAANDNKGSKEKLSLGDNATPPELPMQPLQSPESLPENPMFTPPPDTFADEPLDSGPEFTSTIAVPELASTSPKHNIEVRPASEFTVEAKSSLKPIERPNLSFQEDSKGGGVTPTASVGPATISVSATKNLTNEDLKALVEGRQTQDGSGKRRPASSANDTLTTAASSPAGSSSGSTDFDGMMASLLGGASSTGIDSRGGSQNDVLAFMPTPTQQENIFRHASHRYKQAGKENRLKSTAKRRPQTQVVPF